MLGRTTLLAPNRIRFNNSSNHNILGAHIRFRCRITQSSGECCCYMDIWKVSLCLVSDLRDVVRESFETSAERLTLQGASRRRACASVAARKQNLAWNHLWLVLNSCLYNYFQVDKVKKLGRDWSLEGLRTLLRSWTKLCAAPFWSCWPANWEDARLNYWLTHFK